MPFGGDCQRLEQRSHLVRPGQPVDLALQALACCFVGFGAEPAGAFEKAHAEQEFALGHQMRRQPCCPRGIGQRGKIHMRGEVRLAGMGQHVLICMPDQACSVSPMAGSA